MESVYLKIAMSIMENATPSGHSLFNGILCLKDENMKKENMKNAGIDGNIVGGIVRWMAVANTFATNQWNSHFFRTQVIIIGIDLFIGINILKVAF